VKRTTLSERALVLAPRGRDAAIAVAMLSEGGIEATACPSLPALVGELDAGAAFVVVTEEAIEGADLHTLVAWIEDQEEWSDLPIVLLTHRGGLERNPAAARFLDLLVPDYASGFRTRQTNGSPPSAKSWRPARPFASRPN
jgi:hypothetical protein